MLDVSPTISIIIPARNEEASVGACLDSLVSQTGVDFEIIVVDDHSTDRTRAIAESFSKVRVTDAGPLPPGWTGKNNAVASGARDARGEWLLFTDADTIHLPGSLERALTEARGHNAGMLSYSPEQTAITFWERAILPVVFSELTRQYPPSKVSEPSSPQAAANGQFILIRRATYDAINGHASVAGDILEDVALARRVKSSGYKLRFRYADDAVRTRMYRNFAQLREGWTKNLALLFPHPGRLAFYWGTSSLVTWLALVLAVTSGTWTDPRYEVSLGLFGLTFLRIKRANFSGTNTLIATILGPFLFAYLLLRSKRAHGKGTVLWKGRTYQPAAPIPKETDPIQPGKSFMKTPPALILLTILLFVRYHAPVQAQPADDDTHFLKTMIEPGQAVGPLKINDSRDHALELFPKKDIDQEWEDPCGTTMDWIDSTNPVGHGDVFIRMKKGRVFQIESSTTRFHTAEDITTFDSPEKVAHAYKDMRAYVLLTAPNPAIGSRPLVFWVDKKKGIAFALAFDPSHHKRYVYKIIVFESNKNFCPEQETINSMKWQSIDPYAVEPPRDLSPEP